jgi:hypothetical protein
MEVSGQIHALAALPPGKRGPDTHWTGGWVGPRAGLDNVEKMKTLHRREAITDGPAGSLSFHLELTLRIYGAIPQVSYSSSWLSASFSTGTNIYIPNPLMTSSSIVMRACLIDLNAKSVLA